MMKIALIGQGAMGQLVGAQARAAGHEIALTLSSPDAARSARELAAELSGCDVAIDFSVAQAVRRNVEACALSGVPPPSASPVSLGERRSMSPVPSTSAAPPASSRSEASLSASPSSTLSPSSSVLRPLSFVSSAGAASMRPSAMPTRRSTILRWKRRSSTSWRAASETGRESGW